MRKENLLKEGERLDDLEFDGLMVIQHPDKYCFTSDAVLLANLAPSGTLLCDLGTGSGIMPIISVAKGLAKHADAVELQPYMADMAQRSVSYNGLQDKINVYCVDIKNAPEILGKEKYDVVLCNPPFYKIGAGGIKESAEAACSRHETDITFAAITEAAKKLLKYGGKFCFIHKCERLAEALYLAKSNSLEPKKITLIYPKADKQPDTFVCECRKGGAEGVKVQSLTVYNNDGTMTDTAKKLYRKS